MKKLIYAMALAGLAAIGSQANAETIRLCSPADYTVWGISDNGEWALGVQGNAMTEMYAFRWNLITNEIDVSPVPSMCGTSIADNGTFCGGFNYTDEQGRTTVMPGYFDGTWHLLPMPEGKVTDAYDGAISPDGRHMALTIEINGKGKGVQYKDNEIVRILKSDDYARVYDITDDGSKIGGWTYAIVNGKLLNRTGVYWEGDSNYKIIDRDPSKPENSPWAGVRRFSTDGNYALYYGGWTVPKDGFPYVESIKNLTTGEITKVNAVDKIGQDFQLNDMSDDLKVVGSYNYLACIAEGDKTYYLTDWLKEKKGIDAKAEWTEVMTTEANAFLLTSATCIQHNGKSIGMMYNGTDMEMHSMVVRFDVTLDNCAPVTVNTSEITKALATRINWVMPYGMDLTKVKGYNIYRNGEKINDTPVVATSYYDSNLEGGKEYKYQITAIYEGGESEKSSESVITIANVGPEQPTSVVVRQKGFNSVSLTWDKPSTNLVRKYYYDEESLTEGFGTSELQTTAEAGIKYSADEMALYGNSKITGVEFYPLSKQQGWVISLYSENEEGKLTTIKKFKVNANNLKIGERNVFTLPEAIDIPKGQNLIVSVSVTVVEEASMRNVIGMQLGKVTKGYSDLLRRADKIPPESFKSLIDMAAGSGMSMQVSWKLGIILTPEGASADIDKIDNYVLTRDGNEIHKGSDMKYLDANMKEGTYNYGLTAVYSDGRKSEPVTAIQKVATPTDPVYGAQDVAVELTSDKENIKVTWKAPAGEDVDLTDVTWAHGNRSTNTNITSSNNNYNLQAAAIYPPSHFKGLVGYNIVGAKFFPTCDATYTIIVDNGVNTEQLAYYEVDSYKQGEWNTFYFDKPIALDLNKKYRLIVDCYDVEDGGSPLAVDDCKGVDGFSCMINVSDKEEDWQEVSAAIGTTTNWMIGLLAADPNPTPLELTGYDVKLDDKKLNESILTKTEFEYPVASIYGNTVTRHDIVVDTWYKPSTTAVPGTPVVFTINGVGVDETFIADLHISNDGAILKVSTATDIVLYDMNGIRVAYANGDSVRIDDLASGIYVVKATTAEGKGIATKVNISR